MRMQAVMEVYSGRGPTRSASLLSLSNLHLLLLFIPVDCMCPLVECFCDVHLICWSRGDQGVSCESRGVVGSCDGREIRQIR